MLRSKNRKEQEVAGCDSQSDRRHEVHPEPVLQPFHSSNNLGGIYAQGTRVYHKRKFPRALTSRVDAKHCGTPTSFRGVHRCVRVAIGTLTSLMI